MSMNRRTFLGTSAAAVVVAGTMAKGKVFGANEKIRVACVGIGGRGKTHLEAFSSHEDSEVVALCDVDSQTLENGANVFERVKGRRPRLATDVRELLARDDIDAISVATPNHTHTLISIWACMAGKDVYVEKPLAHEVWEGRQLVAAAEKHGRIVQHGTQGRSEAEWISTIKLLHEGVIGELHTARALGYKNGNRGDLG
ncbi:MAG: Gfo/Idh/MocA family oxidoreductase, partial [Candidatus Hydrogenedentes bacterium]|nr:Gfo/Idh/MocA family oxidoreductase [Candidatus Hydrogenedentota bacterium]